MRRKRGNAETYRKIAEKKLGRKLRGGEVVHHIDGDYWNHDPENLEVMSYNHHAQLHNGGKSPSAETRDKMSAANKGQVGPWKGQRFSDSHRKAISDGLRGKPKSPEHVAKVVAANRGRKVSAAQREKIADALRGRRHSEDYKRRHSERMRQWWADRKAAQGA